MGIFDKAESEAEDMAQTYPNSRSRLSRPAAARAAQGQDMQTAQNMVGQQGGSRDYR